MKNRILLLLCFFLLCSHDMFLKMDSYFIEPNQDAVLHLFNGTFEKSENVIDRDRMLDASLVGGGERIKLKDRQWSEMDSITILSFKSGEAGTWVAGLSTKARSIEMEAKDFNDYLAHDGILDMIAERKENGSSGTPAIEKYSKHVKAIFQVGDKKSSDWSTQLGYPIEFIPLSNPYELNTGEVLKVKLLRDGQALSGQLVYADYAPDAEGHTHEEEKEVHTHEAETKEEHSHGTEEEHVHEEAAGAAAEPHSHATGQQLRTDANGVVEVTLSGDGIWYLRTIHLVTTEEEGLTHESNWATLTFEVIHGHAASTTEEHTHHEEEGIPLYAWLLGSLLVLSGLFFFFNRKK